MILTMMQALFDYDRWANRRLLDVVAALPAAEPEREVGQEFSAPTLKGLLAHILGAEAIWLKRWHGESPTSILSGKDFPDLDALRASWDQEEEKMHAFLSALTEADLSRVVHYRDTKGRSFAVPLWILMQHVANHSTHHRSEVATMLTRVSGSPPATDLVIYHLARSGQIS